MDKENFFQNLILFILGVIFLFLFGLGVGMKVGYYKGQVNILLKDRNESYINNR